MARWLSLGGVCIGALLAAPACAAGPPADPVATWVRLKGDAAGAVTYEWVKGTAYGVPDDGIAVTLFDIESVTLRQFLATRPGHYVEQTFACRLYRDPESGAYIDEFVNPMTARSTELRAGCSAGPTVRYAPEAVTLLSDLAISSSALGGPMQLQMIDAGDHVVIRRESHSEFVSPSTGQRRREVSVDTFKLSRADLDRDDEMLAPAYSWVSVTQWMASLKMGERGGRMLWTVDGRNYRSADSLPAAFRKALSARFPRALAHRFDWSAHRRPDR